MLRQVVTEGSKKFNFLVVEDSCFNIFSMRQLSNDLVEVKINVKFKVQLRQCIKEGHNAVKISLITPNSDDKFEQIETDDGTKKATIDNIKEFLRKRYQRSKSSQDLIISTIVDLTSKVDNSFIRSFLGDKGKVNRLRFEQVNVDSLNQEGSTEAFVVRSFNPTENNDEFDTGSFFDRLIKIHGLDPSDVSECSDDVITTHDSYYGSFEKLNANKNVTKIFQDYRSFLTRTEFITDTSQVPSNSVILKPVVRDVSNDYVEFKKLITFVVPITDDIFSSARLKFELLNINNIVIDTTRRDISLLTASNTKFLPKKPPQIKATRSNGLTGFIVTTNDELTRGVKVYLRSVRDTNVDFDVEYKFIADLPFTGNVGGTKQLTWCDIGEVSRYHDKKVQGLTSIYRFVPYGMTPFNVPINSSLFKNVVVNNHSSYANVEIGLVCVSTSDGVQVITPKLPNNCVSLNVFRRNLTKKEKKFTQVGQALFDSNNLIDDGVIDDHTYEYICRLNYVTGQSKESGRTIHKFVRSAFSQKQVKLSIKNLEIDQSSNDVRFELMLEKFDSDENLLKKMLLDQNLSSYFNDEIFGDRTKLEDLLAFRISRIDMASGRIERFSISNDSKFSDLRSRKKDNIPPPISGRFYKYVVDALLRTPVSTVNNLFLTASVNGEDYVYSPQKYQHPLNLKKGIFGTPEAIKARYAENFMEFGEVGISSNIDVITNSKENIVNIINVKVEKIDDHHENVSFDIDGPIEYIDHFLIVCSCSGSKRVVGRATPFDQTVNAIIEIKPSTELEPRKYFIVLVKK